MKHLSFVIVFQRRGPFSELVCIWSVKALCWKSGPCTWGWKVSG